MKFEEGDYCACGAAMVSELYDSNILKCPVCGRVDLKRKRRVEEVHGTNYRKEGK